MKLLNKVVDFFFNVDSNSFSGALVGYTDVERIHIIDLYNCYGIDAVVDYLS